MASSARMSASMTRIALSMRFVTMAFVSHCVAVMMTAIVKRSVKGLPMSLVVALVPAVYQIKPASTMSVPTHAPVPALDVGPTPYAMCLTTSQYAPVQKDSQGTPPGHAATHFRPVRIAYKCVGGTCAASFSSSNDNCLLNEVCVKGTCRPLCNSEGDCSDGYICKE